MNIKNDALEAEATSPPSDTTTNAITSTKSLPSTTKPTTTWYMFPPQSTPTLSPNDEVYIKSKSSKPGTRGCVVENHDQAEDRVDVRLLGEDKRRVVNVARKQCIPIYPTPTTTTILLTNETHAYRHLAASQVSAHDAVLEIGCSTGQASHILLLHTNDWMGMDVSSSMVQQAREYLHTKGHVISQNQLIKHDVLVDPTTAESLVRQQFHPDAIFIDIGGNRDLTSAIRVLQWSITTYTPRLVVIKNQEMVQRSEQHLLITNDGRMQNANVWFQNVYNNTCNTIWWPPHALQAPMVVSPRDGKTPICRYHNYHVNGCKKGTDCPYCHAYCHACRQPGHTAKACHMRNTTTNL